MVLYGSVEVAVFKFNFYLFYYNDKHSHLFTPLTCDMKDLVARQIVREIGETTNLRGCGIQAKPSEDGKLMIDVVLPRKIMDIDKNI